MRRLAEHDAESSVSYMETLFVYLNNNMNITKTANDLYVHRSTLLERIARIERELESDLQNSDERLRIQLLLKTMKIHEIIQCTPTVE
jgi:DNA-binding PucR family transcriptional regulator